MPTGQDRDFVPGALFSAGGDSGVRHKRRGLIEAINKAYEDEPPTTDEKELLQAIRGQQRKLSEPES
jgi:hypothetical protein